jgi:hypothetical protein
VVVDAGYTDFVGWSYFFSFNVSDFSYCQQSLACRNMFDMRECEKCDSYVARELPFLVCLLDLGKLLNFFQFAIGNGHMRSAFSSIGGANCMSLPA